MRFDDMNVVDLEWTNFAAELEGPRFARFQTFLTKFNARSLEPLLPGTASDDDLAEEHAVTRAEIAFVEAVRRAIAPLVADVPDDADAFIAWFERLRDVGPGQGDPLFPWLAA